MAILMRIPRSIRLTYIDQLIVSLCSDDNYSVKSIMSNITYKYGPDEAGRCYKQAVIAMNTKPYEFVSFDAKVISQSDDKSSVGNEALTPSHNQD